MSERLALMRARLLEPLFITSVCLYTANTRLVGHLTSASPFFRNHFNDPLLVPCALPPLLCLVSLLGVRKDRRDASGFEVILCLLVWSAMFEVLGPSMFQAATGDFRDIAAYWVGGGGSWLYWRCSRRRKALSTSAVASGSSLTGRSSRPRPGRRPFGG